MKTIYKNITVMITLCLSFMIFNSSITAQDKWTNYNTVNSGLPDNGILSISIDTKGIKWVGTYGGGLAKFDNTKWTVFNTLNSNIPSDGIYALTIDKNGIKWIGTCSQGIAKYNDSIWTTFNNSSFTQNQCMTPIVIDNNENKWVGMGGGVGLVKINNNNTWVPLDTLTNGYSCRAITIDKNNVKWISVYEKLIKYLDSTKIIYTNKLLTSNEIFSVHIDKKNTIWLGTMKGLIKFDGDTTWTMYNAANSDLPNNQVNTIISDTSGNLWMGTQGGLAKFNGTQWKVYTTLNSSLPHDWVRSLAIGSNNDVWVGTYNGLAVLQEAVGINETATENIFSVYPNPSKDKTVIEYTLPQGSSKGELVIYNLQGQEIKRVAVGSSSGKVEFNSGELQAGTYIYQLKGDSFLFTKKMVIIK